jgi:disease resistance protein RPM1
MAPEYLYRGEISTRSDIYSLGVVIMEITTGEKSSSSDKDKAARDFIDKARLRLENMF